MQYWEESFVWAGYNDDEEMCIEPPPARCKRWTERLPEFQTSLQLFLHEKTQCELMLSIFDDPKIDICWDHKTKDFTFVLN